MNMKLIKLMLMEIRELRNQKMNLIKMQKNKRLTLRKLKTTCVIVQRFTIR